MMKKITLLTVLAAFFMSAINAQTVVTIKDADVNSSQTWTKDKIYLLDGFVYVEDGVTLTIEKGTVVKGKATPSTGDNASALIVAMGGKLIAKGTKEEPIIFTAEDDDPSDPNDFPMDTRGAWGGVILLGKAILPVPAGSPTRAIEGIPTGETRGLYGGTDDADNSGELTYVSIRHGGAEIGAGNEINGLTMGAVGSGTVIHHIEVFSNLDDGYEWFGGTVNCKYLASIFCGDECFDWDEGFRGKGQFWFGLQADIAGIGNMAGEHDGGPSGCKTCTPYSIPVVYNATYIGSGTNSVNSDNERVFLMKDNTGGKYYNSIFTDFKGTGIEVEDLASGQDARQMLEDGNMLFMDNIWYGFGAGNTWDSIAKQDFVRTKLMATGNTIVDPQIKHISRLNTNGLMSSGKVDPRIKASSPAASGATPPADSWYSAVTYKGAFGVNDDWLDDWTALSTLDILALGVKQPGELQGMGYNLSQNQPNPANGNTSISITLPGACNVSLNVYDMTGKEVMTLINNEYQTTGTQTITFSTSKLSSGVYYYTLKTAKGSISKKMVIAE